MHDDELWQIFTENGTPLAGKGANRAIFNDPASQLHMSNAHIWFWKKDGDKIEIMLQKRAMNIRNRPGWYHISAGGHINVGETPVQAAVREVKEEMGFNINPEKLYFVQAVRIMGRAPRDIVNVFLYQLQGDEEFTHDDGEAGSFEWRTLQNFTEITKDAESNHLVPQGELYFRTLIAALEYASEAEVL